jgi:predicted TPR repeat methyltransferase
MKAPELDAVYAASSTDEAEHAYDAWASRYDADLMQMGYRLPWYFAATVLNHLPRDTGPILDAGCGTGLQIEPLHLMGWRGFTGIDLSTGMMAVARAKGLYDDLRRVTLGEVLPFETGHFAATLSCGTITPGHAPIETLDELVRVTRKGGHLVFSLRHDAGQEPTYLAYPPMLEAMGRIRTVHLTPDFATMPLGEPDVRNKIHVCQVL